MLLHTHYTRALQTAKRKNQQIFGKNKRILAITKHLAEICLELKIDDEIEIMHDKKTTSV